MRRWIHLKYGKCFYYRYRQALVWEDKTIDYFSGIVRGNKNVDKFDNCLSLTNTIGQLRINSCWSTTGLSSAYHAQFLCQRPDQSPHTQSPSPLTSQQAWPSLATVNATTLGYSDKWWLVACPSRHVTHAFLACDVSTSCWAARDISFSLLSESWALPASQSCQAHVIATPLPPSFPCESNDRRVPYSLVCDHRSDCADGSDETFCAFSPCRWLTQLQCLNKQVGHTWSCLCVSKCIYYVL